MSETPSIFSSGQELANLVLSSGLLLRSWNKISELHREGNQNISLRYKVCQESNCTIIAFIASPTCTEQLLQENELVSSSSRPLFQFLCSKRNPSFGIHKAAMDLFDSFHDELTELQTRLSNSSPLIITGLSLGGSVAFLFTLWLLKNINEPGAKRPLCITFGAPLIGDEGLQQAMSHSPLVNSCFLHVAAKQDSVPRLFIQPHNPNAMEIDSQTGAYRPFGTFLLCSESGYTCVEDPEAVSELLEAMSLETVGNPNSNEEWQISYYQTILERLMSIVITKGMSKFGELIVNSLRAGIVLQLEAIGFERTQQNGGNNTLIARLEKACMEKKKKVFDPSKKLNDIKIYMAFLEWYKKRCKSENKGYYDGYKNNGLRKRNVDVVKFKKYLNDYWEKMVAEAEKMPQSEEASFRKRYRYGGTNYRRMVEPLDIAEYYKDKGLRDYKTNGRSPHYIKLEQWLNEAVRESSNTVNSRKGKVSEILTLDSCFWANVEEALILCKLIKNGENKEFTREKLIEFEKYVMEQINNYAVSSEIFLKDSSFMQWWREYEEIIGTSGGSELANYMKNGMFNQY